jgi:hypothetical protein
MWDSLPVLKASTFAAGEHPVQIDQVIVSLTANQCECCWKRLMHVGHGDLVDRRNSCAHFEENVVAIALGEKLLSISYSDSGVFFHWMAIVAPSRKLFSFECGMALRLLDMVKRDRSLWKCTESLGVKELDARVLRWKRWSMGSRRVYMVGKMKDRASESQRMMIFI